MLGKEPFGRVYGSASVDTDVKDWAYLFKVGRNDGAYRPCVVVETFLAARRCWDVMKMGRVVGLCFDCAWGVISRGASAQGGFGGVQVSGSVACQGRGCECLSCGAGHFCRRRDRR